jgi:hypothetical protein
MRIKNFYEFLLEKKIEVSNELKNKLESLKKSNLVCAKFSANLLDFLNSEQIRDDAKADKVDLSMQSKLLDVIYNNAKRPYKLGNFLTYIGFDKYYAYTALEVQDFVSNITKTEGVDNFKEVYGKDIRWAYHGDNYEKDDTEGIGDLNKSCMRYTKCQKYFDIYTENPEVVCLLVLYNPEGLVRGRCLIWNVDDERYADRLFCSNVQYNPNFYQYFERHNIKNTSNIPNVEIKQLDYKNFPYMDTLKYYDPKMCTLSTYAQNDDYALSSTDGSYTVYHEFTADCGSHEGEYINEEDVIFLDDGRIAHVDDCLCDYKDNWCLAQECIKLEYPKGEYAHCEDDEMVQLSIDIYGDEAFTINKYVCYVERSESDILLKDSIELYDGNYEHKDNLNLLVTLYGEIYGGECNSAYRDDENIMEIKNKDETKSIFILKADKDSTTVQKDIQRWLEKN